MKNRDVNYFDLLIDGARICYKASQHLESLLKDHVVDPQEALAMHDIEHEGDELYHRIYRHLNLSFITPIEREDILQIARNIEETIDTIDEVAIMFNMLSINVIRSEAIELVKLIVKSCKTLLDAMIEFKNFKKSKQLTPLLVEINHIEEEGDQLYQNAIKTLFSKESNVLEVVKWQNIFDTLEDVLDANENVADVMEGVIIKNS